MIHPGNIPTPPKIIEANHTAKTNSTSQSTTLTQVRPATLVLFLGRVEPIPTFAHLPGTYRWAVSILRVLAKIRDNMAVHMCRGEKYCNASSPG